MQTHLLDTLQVLKIYRHATERLYLPKTYSYVSLNVIVSTLITICLQWSPTEADIFASCSVDGTILVWDIRTGKKPCISVKAHKADVNVISWNRFVEWETILILLVL
jgi:WD40 repeat protein